jgi:hypothetical protein
MRVTSARVMRETNTAWLVITMSRGVSDGAPFTASVTLTVTEDAASVLHWTRDGSATVLTYNGVPVPQQ